MDSQTREYMERLYGAEWRLVGQDVSHIHVGYWYDDTPILDIDTAHEHYLREVFRDVSFAPDDLVLDIGAGNGATAIWVAEQFGCRVHAVDIVELHTDIARRAVAARGLENRVTVTRADVADLAFASATFDHAYSLECLHHVPDRRRVFTNLSDWIKPGGRLVLSDQTLQAPCPLFLRWAVEQVSGSTHMTDLDGYRTVLEANGFVVRQTRDVTRPTLLKAGEWVRRDPRRQVREYARRTTGALSAYLMPIILRLGERAAVRGYWSLQFITAQREP